MKIPSWFESFVVIASTDACGMLSNSGLIDWFSEKCQVRLKKSGKIINDKPKIHILGSNPSITLITILIHYSYFEFKLYFTLII